MATDHTVNYHPVPSELSSKISHLINLSYFLSSISKKFVDFFVKELYIPAWLGKILKFTVLKSLENACASQKIES